MHMIIRVNLLYMTLFVPLGQNLISVMTLLPIRYKTNNFKVCGSLDLNQPCTKTYGNQVIKYYG